MALPGEEYEAPACCKACGRGADGEDIPVNTVGRWLFGVPGYRGHLSASAETNSEVVTLAVPSGMPEAAVALLDALLRAFPDWYESWYDTRLATAAAGLPEDDSTGTPDTSAGTMAAPAVSEDKLYGFDHETLDQLADRLEPQLVDGDPAVRRWLAQEVFYWVAVNHPALTPLQVAAVANCVCYLVTGGGGEICGQTAREVILSRIQVRMRLRQAMECCLAPDGPVFEPVTALHLAVAKTQDGSYYDDPADYGAKNPGEVV